MARYGKIENGVIVGINVTTAQPSEEWVSIPENAQLGDEDQGGGTYAPPAAPAPKPVPLERLQFIRLGQTAGGMTDAQFVAAGDDSALTAMWRKLDMATVVERDDPDTQAAIAALDALGYLPNGAAAVLAAWPVG